MPDTQLPQLLAPTNMTDNTSVHSDGQPPTLEDRKDIGDNSNDSEVAFWLNESEPAQEKNPKGDGSEKHVEEEERFPAIPLDDPFLTRHDHHLHYLVDSSSIGYIARQLPHFGVERFECQATLQETHYVAGLQAAMVAITVHFIMFHERYPDNWEPPFRFENPDFGDNNPQPTVLTSPEEIAAEIAATRQSLPSPYDFEYMIIRHALLQITTISQGHQQDSELKSVDVTNFPSLGSDESRYGS
jgi:hypothetical protein